MKAYTWRCRTMEDAWDRKSFACNFPWAYWKIRANLFDIVSVSSCVQSHLYSTGDDNMNVFESFRFMILLFYSSCYQVQWSVEWRLPSYERERERVRVKLWNSCYEIFTFSLCLLPDLRYSRFSCSTTLSCVCQPLLSASPRSIMKYKKFHFIIKKRSCLWDLSLPGFFMFQFFLALRSTATATRK